MMVFDLERIGNPPEFTVFNTLIPQDHPRSLRRFRVPMRYRNWLPSAFTDREMSLGTLNPDNPLIVDPSQAFIILELFGREAGIRVFIVVRTQSLIKYTCSMDTEDCIPWEEWGRDAMIMEMRSSCPQIYIQGTHVVEVKARRLPNDVMERMYLRTFDFSKQGCSMFWGEGGEVMQAVWYKGGRDLFLEESENMIPVRLSSLGNGTFFYLPVRSSLLYEDACRLIPSQGTILYSGSHVAHLGTGLGSLFLWTDRYRCQMHCLS